MNQSKRLLTLFFISIISIARSFAQSDSVANAQHLLLGMKPDMEPG